MDWTPRRSSAAARSTAPLVARSFAASCGPNCYASRDSGASAWTAASSSATPSASASTREREHGIVEHLLVMPVTPFDSMPELVQTLMLIAPITHFVCMAQAILYRGAGLDVVWPKFLAIIAIGSLFFAIALTRFRSTIGAMA